MECLERCLRIGLAGAGQARPFLPVQIGPSNLVLHLPFLRPVRSNPAPRCSSAIACSPPRLPCVHPLFPPVVLGLFLLSLFFLEEFGRHHHHRRLLNPSPPSGCLELLSTLRCGRVKVVARDVFSQRARVRNSRNSRLTILSAPTSSLCYGPIQPQTACD